MSEAKSRSSKLTVDEMCTLLGIAAESKSEYEFDRLVSSSSEELVEELRQKLEANNLEAGAGARLLGVNSATLKTWLNSSDPLSENTHQKLAGLCLVLALAESADRSEATDLARAAVGAVQRGTQHSSVPNSSEPYDILVAVLGGPGLVGAALNLALNTEPAESPSRRDG